MEAAAAVAAARKCLSKEEEEKLAKAYVLWDCLCDQGHSPSIAMHPNPNKADGVIVFVNGKEFTDEDAKSICLPKEKEECTVCDGDPCHLECMRAQFDDWVDDCPTDVFCNKEIRCALHRRSSEFLHGKLGYGNGKPLPRCVEKCIKDTHPEEDGECKGYEDA
jgi:hypothetical protein